MNRFFELKNIALGKESRQKRTHGGHVAKYANDGDESCGTSSQTDDKHKTYWMVDLGKKAVVLNVTVKATKESDENGSRFTIKVGDSTENFGHNNPDCVTSQNMPYQVMQNFTCIEENVGRYVTIYQFAQEDRRLKLCEVQVYGIYL